jgi:adenylate cyclase
MVKEIERKFLVRGNTWRGQDGGKRYRQGYLSIVKERTVRVRITGDKGFITIKGMSVGATRSEYEYESRLPTRTRCLIGFASGR